MAELVDALDLGSSELARAGSSPVLGIFIGFSNYPSNPLINRDLRRELGLIPITQNAPKGIKLSKSCSADLFAAMSENGGFQYRKCLQSAKSG